MTRTHVLVEGLAFWGHHGVYEEERTKGQRFLVDLCGEVVIPEPERDDIATCVDYATLSRIVLEINQAEAFQTLEAFAARIIEEASRAFPTLVSLDVTIRKPDVKVDFTVGSRGVSMCWPRVSPPLGE